ncbi:unnamed protein product, partial [Bubo scandiacus]
ASCMLPSIKAMLCTGGFVLWKVFCGADDEGLRAAMRAEGSQNGLGYNQTVRQQQAPSHMPLLCFWHLQQQLALSFQCSGRTYAYLFMPLWERDFKTGGVGKGQWLQCGLNGWEKMGVIQKQRVPVAWEETLWTGGERNQSGLKEKLL